MRLGTWTICVIIVGTPLFVLAHAEQPYEPATSAILKAFKSHSIVMLGETHGGKQEYEWLRSLVTTPEFHDLVDDVVLEFGNSKYQDVVDRYERGENVSLDEVQHAWLDTIASVGPPSPVYSSLYESVRASNISLRGHHQVRVLCGDPSIDWAQIIEAKDLRPYVATREQVYADVVKNQVMAKHHHALLIMGSGHFLRHFDAMPARKQFDIEQQLVSAGADPFLIVTGTNTTGGPNDVEHRFDGWPAPVVTPLSDSWVGTLPAIPVVMAGRGPSLPGLLLRDAADALLYLGAHETLTTVTVPRSEIEGTPYGMEIARRIGLQMSLER